YQVFDFRGGEECMVQLRENTPHIVIATDNQESMGIMQFFDVVQAVSKEIVFIPIVSPLELSLARRLVAHGAHDLIFQFSLEYTDLLSRVDRALQGLFLTFQNEQLVDQLKKQELMIGSLQAREEQLVSSQSDETPKQTSRIWMKALKEAQNVDNLIQVFVTLVSHLVGRTPCLFMKYVPVYRSLVVTKTFGIPEEKTRSVGISFNDQESRELKELLVDPQNSGKFIDFVKKVFAKEEFFVRSLGEGSTTWGFLVVLRAVEDPKELDLIETLVDLAQVMLSRLEMKKTIFESLPIDNLTGLLHKKAIGEKVQEEVRRAQRINLPVTLIHLGVDDFAHYKKVHGIEGSQTIERMISSILKKTSRSSDLLGRWEEGEFLLLLPHTDKMGAAIKAERLRRVVESTEFPGATKQPMGKITVSLGMSEFPSLAGDFESLLQQSQAAMDSIRNSIRNDVGLFNPLEMNIHGQSKAIT
ncbi:MAG: GGDEF domain-containing protein, partial [Bdellovibrionales bacterium]|nr:GGDEF domain-containing protein [Bdellovibrionales bacterium]